MCNFKTDPSMGTPKTQKYWAHYDPKIKNNGGECHAARVPQNDPDKPCQACKELGWITLKV